VVQNAAPFAHNAVETHSGDSGDSQWRQWKRPVEAAQNTSQSYRARVEAPEWSSGAVTSERGTASSTPRWQSEQKGTTPKAGPGRAQPAQVEPAATGAWFTMSDPAATQASPVPKSRAPAFGQSSSAAYRARVGPEPMQAAPAASSTSGAAHRREQRQWRDSGAAPSPAEPLEQPASMASRASAYRARASAAEIPGQASARGPAFASRPQPKQTPFAPSGRMSSSAQQHDGAFSPRVDAFARADKSSSRAALQAAVKGNGKEKGEKGRAPLQAPVKGDGKGKGEKSPVGRTSYAEPVSKASSLPFKQNNKKLLVGKAKAPPPQQEQRGRGAATRDPDTISGALNGVSFDELVASAEAELNELLQPDHAKRLKTLRKLGSLTKAMAVYARRQGGEDALESLEMVASAVLPFFDDDDKQLRLAGVQVIADLGELAGSFSEYLSIRAEDEDDSVRKVALAAMSRLKQLDSLDTALSSVVDEEDM